MQANILEDKRTFWPQWAEFLHRRGWGSVAVVVLEALGPLTVLGAQALYLGTPFLGRGQGLGQAALLANLLEDPDESRAFALFLREEEAR